MSKSRQTPQIPFPKGWKKQVRSAVLHVIALAQYAAAYTRGWAADGTNARVSNRAHAGHTVPLVPNRVLSSRASQDSGSTTVTFYTKRRHLPIVTLERSVVTHGGRFGGSAGAAPASAKPLSSAGRQRADCSHGPCAYRNMPLRRPDRSARPAE